MADPATADLLRLSQWLSPAFPVGGYAYSHGLDWWIAERRLTEAAAIAGWLSDTLAHGAGRNDAILLSMTHRGAVAPAEAADLAAALAASAERWRETAAQGRAFLVLTNRLIGTGLSDLPLPVAVGAQARHLSLATETVLALYLQAFAGNLVSVATRAVPLGQSEAQAVLADLAPDIAAMAADLATADLADLGGAVPAGDLAAILHETQDVRLYLT